MENLEKTFVIKQAIIIARSKIRAFIQTPAYGVLCIHRESIVSNIDNIPLMEECEIEVLESEIEDIKDNYETEETEEAPSNESE